MCLAGADCIQPVSVEGMNIQYIPSDEQSATLVIDATTANVVIYASGRANSASADVTYSYEGTEMCSAELMCEPCSSYECKSDVDGTPRFSVCDGVGLPRCEIEAIAYDNQRQCDDTGANANCELSFELDRIEPCRDCYTGQPSTSPSTTTSL